jgi:hypothetical protein
MKNRDVNKFVCLGFGAVFAGIFLTGGGEGTFIVANVFLAALFIINAGATDNE